MDGKDATLAQAKLFTVYLIGRQPGDKVPRRYQDALEHSAIDPNARDERLLRFIAKHPWSLRFADAGLALARPHSEIRRRLYLMVAILESTPEYTDFFLPQHRSRLYVFAAMYSGTKAVLKALLGVALIKVVR